MRITISALALAFMAQGILSSGAVAQESGASIIGDTGSEIALSRIQLYRAIGDRIVTGSDVIGNNFLNWQQIDPALPRTSIQIAVSDGDGDAPLLDAVRLGCIEAGGTRRACNKVRLRQDRLDRSGSPDQGMARFDPPAMPLPSIAMPQVVLNYLAPASSLNSSLSGLVQQSGNVNTTNSVGNTQMIAVPPTRPAPQTFKTTTTTDSSGQKQTTVATAMAAPAPERVFATRLFLGRDSFPPESFAAYGILAFNTRATSEDEALYIAICKAFFSALENSADSNADRSAQMVTVWPVDDRRNPDLIEELNITTEGEDSCAKAVEFYDLQIAREAIGHAKTAGIPLSGRGPFLLAWSPAATKGQSDAIVLAADLSDVQTVTDAKDVMRIWREDIEGDPELWQGGFSLEKTRVKLRQIVNRYGDGLLKFFGG